MFFEESSQWQSSAGKCPSWGVKPVTPLYHPFTTQSRVITTLHDKSFNPLPNGKIFDRTELKAFADDKINVTEMMISLSDRTENFVEKEENAGYQHFLLFPQCFQKPSISGSLKVGLCGKELKILWEEEKMMLTRTYFQFPTIFSTL